MNQILVTKNEIHKKKITLYKSKGNLKFQKGKINNRILKRLIKFFKQFEQD